MSRQHFHFASAATAASGASGGFVNANEQMSMQVWMTALYVVVGVLGTVALVLLAWFPGARARARCHRSAAIISWLGWCSLIIWPLWPVAMIWASWRPVRSHRPTVRIRVSPARARIAARLGPSPDPISRSA